MPRKRSLSKTLSPRTRSAVKRVAEVVDQPREQIAFRRGPSPKNGPYGAPIGTAGAQRQKLRKSFKIYSLYKFKKSWGFKCVRNQTDGSTGPSAAHQQQNVIELNKKVNELELQNRLLKAELMQRKMMDEIKELKDAKMEQQQKEDEDGQKKCLDKCEALEKEFARKLGKLLKAEFKQRKMMDEINELKEAKKEQQQKEDAFIGQTQKLKADQKKCLDKYNALEKELARKYICICQFAKLLTRIDEMEAQINGLKEKDEEEGSLSSVPAVEDDDISEYSDSTNGDQMQIYVQTLTGKKHNLNVRPSTAIAKCKAKIKDITGVRANSQNHFDEILLAIFGLTFL